MAARTQARRLIVPRTAGTGSGAPPPEACTAVRATTVRTSGGTGPGRARPAD
jgi:hypothetical protein